MYLKHASFIIGTTFSLFGMEPTASYEKLQLLVGKTLFVYILENNTIQPLIAQINLIHSLSTIIDTPIFKETHQDFFNHCCEFETYKEFLLTETITYINNKLCPENLVLQVGSLMFPTPDPDGCSSDDHIRYISRNVEHISKNDLYKLKIKSIQNTQRQNTVSDIHFSHTLLDCKTRDRIIIEQEESHHPYRYKLPKHIAIAFVEHVRNLIASAHDANHAHQCITQLVHEYLRESESDQPIIVSENLEQYIIFTHRILKNIYLLPHKTPDNYTMQTILKAAFPHPNDDFIHLFQQEIESGAFKSSHALLNIDSL